MLYDQISTCIDAGQDGDMSDRVLVLLCTVCSAVMLIETKIFKLMLGLSKESEIQCCACTLRRGRGQSELYGCAYRNCKVMSLGSSFRVHEYYLQSLFCNHRNDTILFYDQKKKKKIRGLFIFPSQGFMIRSENLDLGR